MNIDIPVPEDLAKRLQHYAHAQNISIEAMTRGFWEKQIYGQSFSDKIPLEESLTRRVEQIESGEEKTFSIDITYYYARVTPCN